MYGTNEELRCPTCAQKRRAKFSAPRHRVIEGKYPVTIGFVTLAVCGTLGRFLTPRVDAIFVAQPVLIAQPFGEVWRLVSSVFLHDNFPAGLSIHLLFNAYWFLYFGRGIEPAIGSARFVSLVLLLGIGSNSAEVLLGRSAIGMSGVVYGLFGFVFALRMQRGYANELAQPHVVQTLVVWFIVCFFLPFVANAAHGFGLLLGWSMGQCVVNRKWTQAGLAAVAAGIVIMSTATIFAPLEERYYLQFGIDPRLIAPVDNQGMPQNWMVEPADDR